jgi:hypothetical protein
MLSLGIKLITLIIFVGIGEFPSITFKSGLIRWVFISVLPVDRGVVGVVTAYNKSSVIERYN